jgi:molybdenum cofactor synthesis domain-containing protein
MSGTDGAVTGSLRASIVVVGDEILDGFVRDSNAAWLAGHLHALGISLERISVVPDEQSAIVEALAAEFARPRPRVVFTSGGIGTTPDDRTMAAVAAFLQVDLVEEPTLGAMVDRILTRLHDRGHNVDEAQRVALRRMALAPRGACSVTGDVASAPSARVDIDGGPAGGGIALIVLPGVPGQFRELVVHLDDTLLADLGSPTHTEQLRHPYPESVLTPLLEDLERRRPDVRIGSYPGPECVLRVHGAPDAVQAVVDELRDAIEALGRDPSMRRLADQWHRGWRSAADGPVGH